MSTLPESFITPEQYLEIERKAEFRSEYHNGEMFAMAGATEAHRQIVTNLVGNLFQQLRSGPCRIYSHDTRIRVKPTGLYTYPDVVVACGERQFLDARRDTLLNPTLIVDVLSPSTESYDRGRKYHHYTSLDSLREYVLVASEQVSIDVFTRQPSGRWLAGHALKIEDTIELESIGCRLALSDVYENVEFLG
jgi:Uma2 family endonuclease